jgi:methionyl-tRNA formyltransferase
LDLVFMGTPDFAATILEALVAAGHRLVAVYTQPPRPAGRGHRLQPSPVQRAAQRHGLELRHPTLLRGENVAAAFATLGADAAVVAAYGLILPRAMLEAPRLGCLNVHASLLPRWRGAAPVQRAVLAGDSETGITIMQMDKGLDTGPILMQRRVPISPRTTAAGLTDELAGVGGELIVAALAALAMGALASQAQAPEGVAYAPKITREEGRLDWRRPAAELERRVRALDLWPGAYFERAHDHSIRVFAAEAIPAASAAPAGTVLDDALAIACGSGALRLLRLQRPGRAPLDAAEFLRGCPIPPGTTLPCPATD